MQVRGSKLTEPLVKGWLLELMDIGKEYHINELYEMVTESHLAAGGLPTESKTDKTRKQQVSSALSDHKKAGIIISGEKLGYWLRASNESDVYTTQDEVETAGQARAEVIVGEGHQAVYGWYLPTYRVYAESQGKSTWGMKVGRTAGDAETRMTTFYAPERPVLGFLLRTDDAKSWEGIMHGRLRLEGKHLPEGSGTEWFTTSPEELRRTYLIMKPDTEEQS